MTGIDALAPDASSVCCGTTAEFSIDHREVGVGLREAGDLPLEASSAKSTFPGMDIVSVGPTLENVHSPDERLKVDTVRKAYDLIVATLEQVV